MQAKAAVLYEVKKPLVVEDVELLEPGPHDRRLPASPARHPRTRGGGGG
jgi:Zn-dependent alcohol dehydrogenase